jgi:hypothetical protein
MSKPPKADPATIEAVLHHLNCRWKLAAISNWSGGVSLIAPPRMYAGYEAFLSPVTLEGIETISDPADRRRLHFNWIDHHLQYRLQPYEHEMQGWMKGAAAHVEGHKIYFADIIPWCLKGSNRNQRRLLQKETGPLCKFMKPLALNYWEMLLEVLQKLHFEDYLGYCRRKKGKDLLGYRGMIQALLDATQSLYFHHMQRWCRKRMHSPMEALTRFDAINLLGLEQFDDLLPDRSIRDLSGFFGLWGLDARHNRDLCLVLDADGGGSAQAMCVMLSVPEEIYILMRPVGGWIDLETLWHEMGHALAALYTSPRLSFGERNLETAHTLSEAYAFLAQNICLSRPFLENFLGLPPEAAQRLAYYKVLKDLALFRRYAAKFLSELDMFASGALADGRPYAERMASITGFYHQPESHLFDLVPELYCLDYLLGWLLEATLEADLKRRWGAEWMLRPEAGQTLRCWWAQGNRFDLRSFLEANQLGPLKTELLMQRWVKGLQTGEQ